MEKIAEVASTLSHDDLLEVTKSSLKTYISNDQLLSDLPEDVILEEIESLVYNNSFFWSTHTSSVM